MSPVYRHTERHARHAVPNQCATKRQATLITCWHPRKQSVHSCTQVAANAVAPAHVTHDANDWSAIGTNLEPKWLEPSQRKGWHNGLEISRATTTTTD